jgi:hypothetical protein
VLRDIPWLAVVAVIAATALFLYVLAEWERGR